ncbi:MAG TPA: tryptophan--tRNA ligase [Candidatus Onthoplasma faecigallinarum]|nr:tryptophan--tRNA ligase [Candidatus Onthoplasma faecigallinarum]
MKNIILTGDRPTGKLHLGHYVGSLKSRLELQAKGGYDNFYIMLADAQALTDNFGNVQKVKDNVLQVMLDYLAVGLDPTKVTFFIQSEVSELTEFTFYYMNLVTLARLERNPTVKEELKSKEFKNNIPMGFLTYPVSQTADITAFNATIVPVGDDQLPMIEQAREIVRSFNNLYGDTLVEPKAVLPKNENCYRLVGIDGKAKMSKSLGNCIYLSDEPEEIRTKVFSMYTDPDHVHVEDPGKVEGNVVFTYLDVFSKPEDFEKYLPEYKNLDELKAHYTCGGLGDMKIKKFLNNILQDLIKPIRERRKELEKDTDKIFEILRAGTKKAREVAFKNLIKLKTNMGINYFN